MTLKWANVTHVSGYIIVYGYFIVVLIRLIGGITEASRCYFDLIWSFGKLLEGTRRIILA